jgi:hypothetical protein
MEPCERCSGLNRNTPATVKITYGLHQAYVAGRPHHVVALCHECAKALYDGDGCVPLKNLVTAGFAHYAIEPIKKGT